MRFDHVAAICKLLERFLRSYRCLYIAIFPYSADDTKMPICCYFYTIQWAGVEPSPLLLQPLISLLYQPRMIDGYGYGAVSGMNEWQGNSKYSENTCPSAALTSTDATLIGAGSNLGCRGGKPANNRQFQEWCLMGCYAGGGGCVRGGGWVGGGCGVGGL
jgi:hypothetical protein